MKTNNNTVIKCVFLIIYRKSETVGQEINKERKIQNGARQD